MEIVLPDDSSFDPLSASADGPLYQQIVDDLAKIEAAGARDLHQSTVNLEELFISLLKK